MATIICPDRNYQGTVGSVTFTDGVSITDDPRAIAFCRASGYEIVEDQDLTAPPPGNASQEAWADWFLANVPGLNEAEVRAASRDDLRDMYASTHDPK